MHTELPSKGNGADAVELLVARPEAIREAAVAFWFARKQWPDWPIEKYYTVWDWRYGSLSDGPAAIYVARKKDSGRLIGHIVIYRRHFRLNGDKISVGVPGNLALHPDFQGGVAGASLASYPSRQLRAGAYDVLLAFANKVAHDIFLRLGAQDLGATANYTTLQRSGFWLRHRAPALAPLSFILDAGIGMRQAWLRRRHRTATKLEVVRLTGGEFQRLDRSHWVAPRDRVVSDDSADFVVRRHLECPYAERELFGLIDAKSSRCEGYVVIQGTGRVELWDVQVNGAAMDIPTAVLSASRAFRRAHTIVTSAIPGTLLAEELVAAGFVGPRDDGSSHYPRLIDATIRPRHPLTDQLKEFTRWNLWTGASQY